MKTKFSMQRAKILATQLAWEFIGSVFIAAGIYNFAVQAKFPMTGFSGISIILYRLLNIPIGFSTILLNIPLAIICYRLLGRKFFISSLRCMVISSLMIDYVAPLFPVYEGDRLLAALCTGVFGGIGYALIYSKNSSTGGSDFIIMAVKAIKPHLSLGKIAFWSDVGIILVGGILFRDIDGIIYGMVVNFIFAVAVDKLMYGINAGKLALIVTEHSGDRTVERVKAMATTFRPLRMRLQMLLSQTVLYQMKRGSMTLWNEEKWRQKETITIYTIMFSLLH